MTTEQRAMEEFFDLHDACLGGRVWALSECRSMADVWDKAKPEWLLWVATRPEVLNDRTLRLFACWCVRQVWHLLDDERSRNAVEVAERFARGEASIEELTAARDAARAAARTTAEAAAWDATRDAARDAARAAARTTAEAAAGIAAWDAAWTAQSAWLRENVQNPFRSRS